MTRAAAALRVAALLAFAAVVPACDKKDLNAALQGVPTLTTTSLPEADAGVAYSTTLTRSGGTAPFTFTETGALPAGITLSPGGVLSGTTAATGVFPITVTVKDAHNNSDSAPLTLTVNAAVGIATGALPDADKGLFYSLTLAASGGSAPFTWSRTSGALPAGLSFSAAGLLSGTPTVSGSFPLTFRVDDAAGGFASAPFTLTIHPAVLLNLSALTGGDKSVAYSRSAAASGGSGSYVFSRTGALPAGFSFSAAGLLAGITTAVGSFPLTISVTDSLGQTDSQLYTLVISGPVSVTTSSLSEGDRALPYNVSLGATGGTLPYAWSSGGGLPPGLTLSAAGILSGTPTTVGTYPVTYTVTTAAGGTASKSLTILINQRLGVATLTLPAAAQGVAYTTSLFPANGTPPYLWSAGAGLPTGVTLSPTGVLSGTTSDPITGYSFLATVTDLLGQSASRTLTLNVHAPVTISTGATLPVGDQGRAYTVTLAVNPGTGPYTWTKTAGTLPSGLTLSAAGVLSGTPGAAGTFTPTFKVTDATGSSDSLQFTLVIHTPVALTTSSLPGGDSGVAYSKTLTASGGTTPYTFSITGALPTGITLTGAVLGGTPTATGSFPLTVKVTDNLGQTDQAAMTLVIATAVSIVTTSLSEGDRNFAYTDTLGATGGTLPYTWAKTAGTLPAGVTLSSAGLLSGTPTASGTFTPTFRVTTAAGGQAFATLTLVVNPQLTISTATLPGGDVGVLYSQTLASTGGTAPRTWTTLDTLPVGITLSSAGLLKGTTGGTFSASITFTVTDVLGQIDSKSLTLTINPAVSISTSSLPGADQTVAYTTSLAALDGTAPYTWSKTSGSFPAGITLSTAGVLSGNPGVTGSFPVTYKVTDAAGGTATKALSLTVSPKVSITTLSLPHAEQGAVYSTTLLATAGTGIYTWSETGLLPSGITFDGSTGILSGTPTVNGNFPVSWRVTDAAGGTVARSMTLVVRAPLAITTGSLPLGTQNRPYGLTPATSGGEGTKSWGESGPLPAGMTFSSTTGRFGGTPTVNGVFPVTVTVSDALGGFATQLLSLDIRAPLAITTTTLPGGAAGAAYSTSLAASGGSGTYTWSLNPAGNNIPPGLSLSGAGAISPTITAGTPTGFYSFVVQVADTLGNTATGTLSISVTGGLAGLVVSTTTLPDGTLNAPYTAGLSAYGATPPYTWSIFSGVLPAGVSLSSTGVFSGTPTESGPFPITVMVQDSGGTPATAFGGLTLTVNGALTITSTALPAGDKNVAYGYTVTTSGGTGPMSWAIVGTLPAGIAFDTSTGAFSGTPTATGSFPVTVTVNDSMGAVKSKNFNLTIHGAPTITTTTLPQATIGRPYTFTLTGSGGTPPYSFSTIDFIPLLLSGTTLSGTPGIGTNGTYLFDADLVDAAGGTATKPLSLTINLPVAISTPSLSGGTQNLPYLQTLAASGGTAPFTWTLTGALPAGLTFSSAGVLSGTPTEAGGYSVSIKVTDANGSTSTSPFSFSIGVGALTLLTSSLPPGDVGTAYTRSVSAAGGTPGYTWATSGTLPPGLSFDTMTGAFSGTPTTIGSYPIDFTVTDALLATDFKTLTIDVNTSLAVTTTALPDGTKDSFYSATLAAVGGSAPLVWAPAAPLPAGLSLSSAGVLSGTPTAAGPATISVTVTDAASASVSPAGFPITIRPPSSPQNNLTIATVRLPDAQVGVAYSRPIDAAGGTTPYTFQLDSSSTALPAGAPAMAISSAGILSGTPTAEGHYTLTVQVTDNSGTANVATANVLLVVLPVTPAPLTITTGATFATGDNGAVYPVTPLAAIGGQPPYTWEFANSTRPPQGMILARTGILYGSPIENGVFSLNIRVRDTAVPANETIQTFALTVNAPASGTFRVPTATLTAGTVGVAYDQPVVASDGTPILWVGDTEALNRLGLDLDSGTGHVFGTPQASGSVNFVAVATKSGAPHVTAAGHITVNVPAPLYGFVTTSIPDAVQDQPYSTTMTITAGPSTGPYTWEIEQGDVSGMSFTGTGTTVTYSGTPNGSSNKPLRVKVTDNLGAETRGLVYFSVRNRDLTVNYTFPPTAYPRVANAGTEGTSGYSDTFNVSNTEGQDVAQVEFRAGAPTPSGLTLDRYRRTLKGTPGASGRYTLLFKLSDPSGSGSESEPVISVAEDVATLEILGRSGFHVSTRTLPAGREGAPYAQSLQVEGGAASGTYAWTLFSGALPHGITLDANGILSGTPDVAGVYPIVVQVVHGASTRQAYFELSIDGALPFEVSTERLPDRLIGASYITAMNSMGATGAVTWSQPLSPTSGTTFSDLGLSMDAAGEVSGTGTCPAPPGLYHVYVQASDAGTGTTSIRSVAILVERVPITFSLILNFGFVGDAYSATLVPVGGSGSYASIAPAPGEFICPGLSLNTSTGVIDSTPTMSTSFLSTLYLITDSLGNTGLGRAQILIGPSLTGLGLEPGGDERVELELTSGGPANIDSVAAASGGTTVYTVASVPGWVGSGARVVITGCTDPLNNGVYDVTAFSLGTITVDNGGGVLQAGAGGTIALFQVDVGAQGGTLPYTFSASPASGANDLLPPGLSLTTVAGKATFSGTPDTIGIYTYTLRVTDGTLPTAATADRLMIFSVQNNGFGPGAVNFNQTRIPDGVSGSPYPATQMNGFVAFGVGHTAKWSIQDQSSGLPTMLIGQTTGVLDSGTDNLSSGVYFITVRLEDTGGSAPTPNHQDCRIKLVVP